MVVNDEQLEGTSFDYVKPSLEAEIAAYINEHRWTELTYEPHERINCQINITLISGNQENNFSAETVFQIRRPIYGTTTETVSLILNDGSWQFNYPEGKSLIHDDLQFENLASFIDFYCYLFLGYDFDSFSPLGGTEYFLKAQNVVDLAQNESTIGWDRSSNNRRNRFVLVSDILSGNYDELRTAYYNYHRSGLDTFISNPARSRTEVVNTLEAMLEAKRRSTSNFLFDLFFDTKSREIAAIFQDADTRLKLDVYEILTELDPGHLTEYEALQN
ncbi:MAG: DUF4835 family protein [Balneolales bacterium]|nr:DUF4835 family protein [Balneolales bacterium]